MPAPAVRAPRATVLVNGRRMDDLLEDARWENNRYLSADSFAVTLVMDESLSAKYPPSFFTDSEELEVEILAGDPTPTTSLIQGRVDDVEIDYDRREIRLAGRDRTADLIETKTTEKWPNRTSSEIATEIATRHGLTPVVTATRTRSGTYYEREHARLTDDTTEWNLLTYLAEMEGFDVYVKGRELHFEPSVNPSTAPRWNLAYSRPKEGAPIATSPAPRFSLRRNLTVARDIVVEVISWNSREASPIRAVRRADRSRRGKPRSEAPAQRYVIRKPGLTQQQAIEEAQRKLEEFSRHERMAEVDRLPADMRLTQRHLLVLSGTGTEFDQAYFIDSIQWFIGPAEGFTMRLRARNLAPVSTASL
jgi:phage protein D